MKRAIPLGTRITNKAADLYARNTVQGLGDTLVFQRLAVKHRAIITQAFQSGVRFELDRLSGATGVDFRAAQKVAAQAAGVFFSHYLRSYRGPNLCTLDGWKSLVDQAFRSGAGFVHRYLWPEQPKPRKNARTAFWTGHAKGRRK